MDGGSPILEFRRAEKRFGRVRALDSVDLAVRPGELVALLGPAGSGTSTMAKLAATLVRSDRGTVAAFGHDLRTAGRGFLGRIGFVFEEPDLDLRLTVDGHLRYRAGLLGLARPDGRRLAARALDRFGLAERSEDRAGVLSTIDRRQLALARAVVGAPALLVADRVADGLEPEERSAVLDPLLRLRAEDGMAILLATGEPAVAAVADRVAVLHRGRIVFDGTRDSFVAAGSGDAAASFATLIRAASAESAGA